MSAAQGQAATESAFSALSQQVLALPDAKFLAAIKVLTPVTDTPEAMQLLGKARERLRELRPERPVSLKRQFCQPFETLLHSGEPGRPGRISRQAIEPVWRFVTAKRPEVYERFQQEFKALPPRDNKALFELSVRLWDTTAKLFETYWPEDAPADLPLLIQALNSAINIENIKTTFPAYAVSTLSGDTVDLVAETMTRLRHEGTPLDAFLLVVASHLDNPVKLLSIMDEKAVPVPGSVASQIDAMAVDALVSRNTWFCNKAENLDAETIASEADRLINDMRLTLEGVSKSARAQLEKQTAGTTARLRDALKKSVIDGAAPLVTAALDANLSIEDREEAEGRARALRRARKAAKEVGLQSTIDGCLNKIHADIDTKITASMARLTKAENLDAPDAAAKDDFFRAIRMLELVEGTQAVGPHLDRMLAIGQK